jgi:TM2 domain-containing membrane protein YozV
MERRDILVAYALWFFLGLLGVHKFYLQKTGMGLLYLLTAGLFLIGWAIDLFTLPSQVRSFNAKYEALGLITGASVGSRLHSISDADRRTYDKYR